MNHVSSYSELNHLSSVINEALAGHADKLSKALSLETIKKECDFLNKIEESVPEDLRFQLELDMILKRGIVTNFKQYINAAAQECSLTGHARSRNLHALINNLARQRRHRLQPRQ